MQDCCEALHQRNVSAFGNDSISPCSLPVSLGLVRQRVRKDLDELDVRFSTLVWGLPVLSADLLVQRRYQYRGAWIIRV